MTSKEYRLDQSCNDCNTQLIAADDFSCEKVDGICPECAPCFVLMRATTYMDVDCPDDAWNDQW
jgi:hypothetical protein